MSFIDTIHFFSKQCFYRLGSFFAFSGLKPSYWLGVINDSLKYGSWIKKYDFIKLGPGRELLWDYLNDKIIKNSPINYLEFGVFQGYSINKWRIYNKNSESRFYGFDSFEGLPDDWKYSYGLEMKKGKFDVKGSIPKIDDSRVSFIKGYFQETLPRFLETFNSNNRLIIHCDADLYSSTLFVLASMNKIIIPGTIIIFDEFGFF